MNYLLRVNGKSNYGILYVIEKTAFILSGGSLGSWIDEGRSQLRYLMRIADTLSIDILNAHCGIGILSLCHVCLRAAFDTAKYLSALLHILCCSLAKVLFGCEQLLKSCMRAHHCVCVCVMI